MLTTQKAWKRNRLKNVSFLVLLLKMCFVFGQKNVIVIDPGHGGIDSGAIGINNIKEKDVALNVAKEIIRLNNTILENKLDIYLTRYKDTLISLSDRNWLAKTLNVDVFVSLHCNRAENSNAKGIEVYIHNSNRSKTKFSISLGLSILNETTQKLDFKKRGVKSANFQVLREAGNYSAVLVEMGFITNSDEANYFLKPKNTRGIAMTILLGIVNYLKLKI